MTDETTRALADVMAKLRQDKVSPAMRAEGGWTMLTERDATEILARLAAEGYVIVHQAVNRCEHGAIREPCVPCSEAVSADRVAKLERDNAALTAIADNTEAYLIAQDIYPPDSRITVINREALVARVQERRAALAALDAEDPA